MIANIPKSSAKAAMDIPRYIAVIPCGLIALCWASVAKAIEPVIQTPPPEIVSAWKFNTADVVVVFRYDGTFYVVDAEAGHPGVERGTFGWDKETGAFSVDVIVDTNGDAGLSHPNGATSISITGNTLNYTVAGEGTFPFTRVVNTASAIVGSWAIPGEKFSVTFLANGTYYLSEETNDIPFGYTGIEKGNYTWNSSTKSFTATAAIDTNGDVGVNGITLGDGVTVNITGNSLVFFDGQESTALIRITTNPTPIRLPDFGAVRIADYSQTSNATPVPIALDPGDESYPYTAEAFVEASVGATAPTIKVGAGTPIPLEPDDEPGSFYIEQGFASLAEINAFLPASSAVQFKNGAATANMTAGASITFPSIPKIKVRDGASWNNGIYRFGGDEVLEWTLPDGFVASKYVTQIAVYDPVADIDVVDDAILQGDVTFLDLSGKLEPGKQYEVELEFYRIDGSTTAGTGIFAGKQGYLLSDSITTFRVRSLPDTAQAPSIHEQPVSQSGTPGSPLLLQAGINGDAFPTATFKWFKDSQSIDGQSGNSLFIPSFDPDAHSGIYKVVVTNPKGVAESDSVIVGPPYPTWKSAFFSPAQLADPAASGDHADFDNDGIDNLLEFVLGGNPIVPNPNLLKGATTTPAASGRNLVFSYDRKKAANGIAQVIETSSTLTGTWTPAVHGVNGVVITTANLDANTQRVTATIPGTQDMLFVRLRAAR
jgi:hypothetical protein